MYFLVCHSAIFAFSLLFFVSTIFKRANCLHSWKRRELYSIRHATVGHQIWIILYFFDPNHSLMFCQVVFFGFHMKEHRIHSFHHPSKNPNSPWFCCCCWVDLHPFILCQFIFLLTLQVCFWLLFLPSIDPIVKSQFFSLLAVLLPFRLCKTTSCRVPCAFISWDKFTLQQTIDLRLEDDTPESQFSAVKVLSNKV